MQILPALPVGTVDADTIKRTVMGYFGIGHMTQYLKNNRSKHAVHARQVGMYLVRILTDLGWNRIGQVFGGRDHTTVIYSYRKIARLISQDTRVFEAVSKILEKLGGQLVIPGL